MALGKINGLMDELGKHKGREEICGGECEYEALCLGVCII